ncbi:monocarboxylate transporter 7-like isoform X1 [Varroa destructor]|uniref:Major facilitator superfamily (MFS) profile domain-containing protein n=1 Tax=Varroa destructor TaxID=109461 RepID=A0A7M7K6X7_VARDE|nr:monocarboxylate transporter 7-like isoform X1 [Varroa destructor]XP_022662109.1 monocarboxylate transporter 7-like isoform X1 [Varroa destructor]XP_022662110.1 monocarboxylate transporter 7-like isoform X1 [Varroa destructor]XP_022662111.1 monocarboxylate transporter 7-like isoform X1 [Varroa destructor]XP_022662112.1 monocarboxylate transporter 7-like isoform X1 [Varroa destructor]
MENAYQDTKRSWLIACACAWNFFWLTIVNRSAGVMFICYQREFNINRQDASWAFSLMDTVSSFTVILCSILYRYVDTRPISAMGVLLVAFGFLLCCLVYHVTVVTIVLGVVVGLGQGMMYFSNAIIINQYFLKNRVSGNGIYFAGGTLGSFFIPPVLFRIVNWCGLRYTFLILGGLACNGWAASILLKSPLTMMKEKQRAKEKALESARVPAPEEIRSMPRPPPPYEEAATMNGSATKGPFPLVAASMNTATPQEETYAMEESDLIERLYRVVNQFKFLLKPIYSMIILSGIAFSFSFVIFPVTAVDFVEEKEYSHSTSALILTTFSIGDISGRLLIGSISDRRYLERDTMMSCIYLVWALGWTLFPLCKTFEQLVPASVLLGFGIGCGTPLYTVLLADYLGVETMPLTFGVYRMILGIVSLARPYCIGYFRDHLRSYSTLYFSLSGYAFLISLLWAVHALITRIKSRSFELRNPTNAGSGKTSSLQVPATSPFTSPNVPAASK